MMNLLNGIALAGLLGCSEAVSTDKRFEALQQELQAPTAFRAQLTTTSDLQHKYWIRANDRLVPFKLWWNGPGEPTYLQVGAARLQLETGKAHLRPGMVEQLPPEQLYAIRTLVRPIREGFASCNSNTSDQSSEGQYGSIGEKFTSVVCPGFEAMNVEQVVVRHRPGENQTERMRSMEVRFTGGESQLFHFEHVERGEADSYAWQGDPYQGLGRIRQH